MWAIGCNFCLFSSLKRSGSNLSGFVYNSGSLCIANAGINTKVSFGMMVSVFGTL